METSIEGFCNMMTQSQVLSLERVRDLRQRWAQVAGPNVGQLDPFLAWLVANHALTEYQVGVLRRGNASQLVVGPYRILERIGKGRMAGVYKAIHSSGLVVALKILPPSKASQPLLFARFQREVKLALSVKDPHVVRSFHVGEYKTLHYLAMEHLEGETLEEVLARPKRLAVSEAVSLVHQAFLGLQAIHEQGLVHRDLKPGNLMLVGGEPNSTVGALVKILDLGTGRALFDEGDDAHGFNLTRPGEMLGSSDYMSPEQAKDAHNIDIRTDIYSLGCVLYHALAGQPPFADSSPVRQLLRHATEEPRPIAEHNPQVPDGLQQVLNWMLAKDPARRYPTPVRAAKALEMFVAASSTPVPRPNTRLDAYLEWVDSSFEGAEQPASKAASLPAARTASALKKPSAASKSLEAYGAELAEEAIPTITPAPSLADARTLNLPSPPARTPPPLADAPTVNLPPRPPPPRKPSLAPPNRGALDLVEEEPARILGLSPREVIVLAIGLMGVFGLGVLVLLSWLAYRLMH